MTIRGLAKTCFAAADRLFPPPPGPRLLIYHEVGAGLGRQMEVTVDDFARQLDWLVQNREVVDLETALARWQEPGSSRLVVITFDDGYRNVHSNAFPLLVERALPFTLYLTTAPVESGAPLGPAPPLTWDQVEEMVASGLVTVGVHTHTHPDLRRIPLAEIVEELETSDRLVEARLGGAPAHFAYPWGYWSRRADGPVRGRYRSATIGGTAIYRRRPDRHRLPRFPVQLSDGFDHFPARLRGGLRLEETTRRLLRRLR